jgi:hypothetical protein
MMKGKRVNAKAQFSAMVEEGNGLMIKFFGFVVDKQYF